MTHLSNRTGLNAARRIVVLRALQLGDMLCAVPALRLLRRSAPHASIVLAGLPWARDFVQRFAAYIDSYVEFPGLPGMPEQDARPEAVPAFLHAIQAQHFDLALQMHGSGELTNPLVARFGAARMVGYGIATDGWVGKAEGPDRDGFSHGSAGAAPLLLPWEAHDNEVLRCLRLVEAAGAQAPAGNPEHALRLEFPLGPSDHADFQTWLRGLPPSLRARLRPGRYVCVHPGARLPSRRWPAAYFADIANRLHDAGLQIVLTGASEEAPLTSAVRQLMRPSARDGAIDLAGATSLGALALIVGDAKLVVCNDTGISHLTAAMATPSVVICSGADAARWAPLNRSRHRVLYRDIDCRPCMHSVCPLPGHPCATGVPPQQVWDEVVAALCRGSEQAADKGKPQPCVDTFSRRLPQPSRTAGEAAPS